MLGTTPKSPTRLLPLCSLLAALCAAPAAAQEQTPTGEVTGAKMLSHPSWFKESFLDLPEDVSEAAESGKHVILIMEMNGCPYCYKLIQENFATAPYRDFIQEHFDVIALNTKGDREVAVTEEMSMSEKELADLYQVRFTPTVVFLDDSNRPVARVSGYRNVDDFKVVLDYVHERAYLKQTLNDYAAAKPRSEVYGFREHPQIQSIDDLAAVADRPLALLFEDISCVACDTLHDGHLADPQIREILTGLTLVRLDARSEAPIIDPMGNATTPKALAESLGIQYTPSIVLFDRGREITRIESMLYRYHFGGVLEYVAGRHYERYPDSPFDYIDVKTAELTAAGKDVSIADE
ncbi:thioredoxin family protein [Thiocapsa sp.]|uniref:thioredoxin family protein n=1 Tax=Thiocapsa sp. TaxID=2024551 RepID=UPI002B7B9618|nr:thioredoxin fold domain-containing protein [Thiocapsa sp.]HSO83800.1 thioredoxin fold domain-containing protein [Thiocapsa sp.]